MRASISKASGALLHVHVNLYVGMPRMFFFTPTIMVRSQINEHQNLSAGTKNEF